MRTAFAFAAFLVTLAAPAAEDARSRVFVVGSLYQGHENVAAYDLASLQRVLDAIRPDVLVLDVSPTELKQQKVWPGKVEYTKVIFPYMNTHGLTAYAGEPDEPLFSRISGGVGKARKQMALDHPSRAQAMEQYRKATYAALKAYWKGPAEVHDADTEQMIAALKSYEAALVGPVEREGSHDWDAYAAAMTRKAVRAHPGKRVLQITGIENLPRVRAELRQAEGIELVDMAAWLRAYDVREIRVDE